MKYLSFSWFHYHLKTFLILVIVFHPFRFKKDRLPIVCFPMDAWPTFLFALVSSFIIYMPIIIFIGNLITTSTLIPELLIVSVFGLIFGTIFRSIQSKLASHVDIYRHELILTFYGLMGKESETFVRKEWKALILYKDKFRSTNNYKLCVELNDGRQVMLELTIFKKRAVRLLESYCKILGLEEITVSPRNIINDGNFQLGK